MGEEALLEEVAALQVRKISDGEIDVAVLHRLGELLGGMLTERTGVSGEALARALESFGRNTISPTSDIANVKGRCARAGSKGTRAPSFCSTWSRTSRAAFATSAPRGVGDMPLPERTNKASSK